MMPDNQNDQKFKVLLVYPDIPGQWVPPVTIGIFTSLLKKAGFEVDLFDATFYLEDESSLEVEKRVESGQVRKFSYETAIGVKLKSNLIEGFLEKIDSFRPDLLMVSAVEGALKRTLSLLDAANAKNIPHIVGGVFVTAVPEIAIAYSQIKAICVGEGENAVLEVAKRLRDGSSIDDVPNLWIKKEDGRIIKNPLGPLVDINEILPDYSLFEKTRFYRPMGGKILRTIPLETSRGCPFTCTYCNSPMWTKLYRNNCQSVFVRRKRIDRVIEEMQYLVEKYKPELLYIIDDCFLARPEEEFNEFVSRYKEINLPFFIITRIEYITEERIKQLKEINCYRISVGIECGNEEFRKTKLKRYMTNEKLLKHMKILGQGGVPFSINNIIGFPDETRDLIFDTIELNRQVSGYDTLTVSIFTPYHGTELREDAIQKGYLDPETPVIHTRESSLLRMKQLTVQQIDGLMRTFVMYVRFPKEWWPHIKIAEEFTEEGNRMFAKLSKMHSEIFLSVDQSNKITREPDWDQLEKQLFYGE
ncbi:MAG: radical SAM protein [Candidatus Nealsonbacteria bacterium]